MLYTSFSCAASFPCLPAGYHRAVYPDSLPRPSEFTFEQASCPSGASWPEAVSTIKAKIGANGSETWRAGSEGLGGDAGSWDVREQDRIWEFGERYWIEDDDKWRGIARDR